MASKGSQPSQLPDGLRYYLLRGSSMTSDESWKLLLEIEHIPKTLLVQAPTSILATTPASTPKSRFLAPDHHVRAESPEPAIVPSKSSRWSQNASDTVKKAPDLQPAMPIAASEQPSSLVESFAAIYQRDAQRIGYRTPYPSGIVPDPSNKKFCTHWIKTGECAFVAVGCKFEHEMPSINKLREEGFTRIPKWWKEKSAISMRGPTWMQRRLASGDDEQDTPPAFPDPSTFQSHGSNLLIHLDDTPAPPPSPQLSVSSTCSSTPLSSSTSANTVGKLKGASRRATRRANAPAKQPGLTNSKHAGNGNQAKNKEAPTKQATQGMQQQKGGDVVAVGLDQNRRNTPKECTKKGSRTRNDLS
ncbi:hypothetical protein FB567DRAFT_587764 [Paraphoma chrysanthemicola]|uniref:C3H1-type domain-containing protein n=1 Tax=Paraphoma chrysanthemicola TaxID=798071 RepID=A0A8K0RFY7_9PLEO|nr:hypothetical protein FB567DRAFT_587764 [Paraphoma chrysanthemicola]